MISTSIKKRARKTIKKIEDAELENLLDVDDAQTQHQLAEALQCTQASISTRFKKMWKIQKGPYELNETTRFKESDARGHRK